MPAKGREKSASKRPGLWARALGTLLQKPAATLGCLMLMGSGSVIVHNALTLQTNKHPAPLFLGTRPAEPAADVAARPPTSASADDIDAILARTAGDLPGEGASTLVADTQKALKDLGYYDGAVDGLAGPMTSAAILHFEEKSGLAPTGIATPELLTLIERSAATGIGDAPEGALSADTPARSPEQEADIGALIASIDPKPATEPTKDNPPAEIASDPRLAKIQEALDSLGYGPLRADGRWNADTRDAIRRFEENRGLAVTGEVNEAFMNEMIKIGGFTVN